MEGNDLGSYWSQKIVVVAEPTLFIPPAPATFTQQILHAPRQWGKRGRAAELTAAAYTVNRSMVQFIVATKRFHNMPTEVWTFLPSDVADILSVELERYSQDAVASWQVWDDERDAVLSLKVDPAIHTVYDANSDRVDRLWHMKGHRVMFGCAP